VKKSLRKLNLSRETLRSLGTAIAGGGPKPSPFQTMTNCLYDTNCDYTYSCPELCGPIVRLTDIC
jgi:hypothetical protein